MSAESQPPARPRDRAPGDLARRISHALRSPLGVVAGGLTETGGDNPELHARLLVLADRGVAQLDQLAQRLGLLGRLDEGLAVQLVDCDLSAVAAQAVAAVGKVRVRRGVEVVVEPSVAAPAVAGDPELLTRACAELVDNAVRFAASRVAISVAASPTGGAVSIRVGHDGDALAPQTLQAALDRGAPLEDRSGLGVGLWMADAIARLHAGSLQIAPAVDPGSAARTCTVLAIPVRAQP